MKTVIRGKGQVLLYTLGIQQKRIADEGFDAAYVGRCLSGKQKPSRRLIEAAVKVTGLPMEALFDIEIIEYLKLRIVKKKQSIIRKILTNRARGFRNGAQKRGY